MLAKPKIREFDMTFAVKKNVIRLEISVDVVKLVY